VRSLLPLLVALLCLCGAGCPNKSEAPPVADHEGTVHPRADERHAMVRRQIASRDVQDERVLAAMEAVPRHRFVPESMRGHAYEDRPLPIGHEVTISQPYIVALMTELARVEAGERVLEVGTGSGYQAAVLAELGAEVYTIERIEPLARRAGELLAELGYDKVEVRYGDGYAGWPERAPFDAILLTAAPPKIPTALTDQLAVGGHLVAPVGAVEGWQELVVITRTPEGLERRKVSNVAFVPMLPGKQPS
jgi:protein-L-isoaspartate(D-aspartate) O-methyltransferase